MRLFIAIDIKNNEVGKLQNQLINECGLDYRYFKPIKKDNLHITLKFLGEKTEVIAKNITYDLAFIQFNSFNLIFDHLDIFPNNYSPRIVWLGLNTESSKKLFDLYSQIDGKLKKYDNGNNKNSNMGDSKRFIPHLTLFRVHNNKAIFDFVNSFSNKIIVKVDTIILKKSELTSNGSIYSDLFKIYACKENA
ncbi:MAG TPA: RNA 2',3'-cyclic phosphodiesterase [Candidatus Nitrosocosmicus sp.]